MTKKRKSVGQREQERYEAESRAWREFLPRLEAVQSYEAAVILLNSATAPDRPGRKFYSNLGFFLHSFAAPHGANLAELREYLRLIRVFDSQGILKQGALGRVEQILQEAIKHRNC